MTSAEGFNDSDDQTLEGLLGAHADALHDELHTVAPGRVEDYDADAQTASVRPMIRRAIPRADGTFAYEPFPILRAVPICHPRWGKWFIHAPLAVGDFVKLEFCERDIARWRVTGELSNPLDVRAHHLAHAVASPGLYPRTKNLGDTPADRMVLGYDGGNTIRVTQSGDIEIGSAVTGFVALANLVSDALTTLKTAITNAVIVPNDGGASFKTTLLAALTTPAWPPNLAAAKVKAE